MTKPNQNKMEARPKKWVTLSRLGSAKAHNQAPWQLFHHDENAQDGKKKPIEFHGSYSTQLRKFALFTDDIEKNYYTYIDKIKKNKANMDILRVSLLQLHTVLMAEKRNKNQQAVLLTENIIRKAILYFTRNCIEKSITEVSLRALIKRCALLKIPLPPPNKNTKC